MYYYIWILHVSIPFVILYHELRPSSYVIFYNLICREVFTRPSLLTFFSLKIIKNNGNYFKRRTFELICTPNTE